MTALLTCARARAQERLVSRWFWDYDAAYQCIANREGQPKLCLDVALAKTVAFMRRADVESQTCSDYVSTVNAADPAQVGVCELKKLGLCCWATTSADDQVALVGTIFDPDQTAIQTCLEAVPPGCGTECAREANMGMVHAMSGVTSERAQQRTISRLSQIDAFCEGANPHRELLSVP